MHKQKNKSGFTLVELLVVISIIALLVSILMPALGSARKQAMQLVCATNLRSLGQGIVMYSGENDGHLPMNLYQRIGSRRNFSDGKASFMIGGWDPAVAGGAPDERWDNMMNDYWVTNLGQLFKEGLLEGGKEVAFCPSNKSSLYSFKGNGGDTNFPSGVITHDPATEFQTRSSYSYLPQHKSKQHPILADFPDAAYKISNLDSGRSMVLDLLDAPYNMFHGRANIFGVNMLMGDTSVIFKLDTDDIVGDYYQDLSWGLIQISGSNPFPWRDAIRQFEWK